MGSPTLRVWLLLAVTPLLPWLGALPGGRWWLPLAAPLTVYAAFRNRARLRDHVGAWRLGVIWAALFAAGVVALVLLRPETAAQAVAQGEAHRREMFRWIATGEGTEAAPAVFLLRDLLLLGACILLSWVSAGYLGLVLAAVLVGSTSYFAGGYAAAAGSPLLGPIVAWAPWSVLQVLAFLLLNSLFVRPLLVRRPWPFEPREHLLLALAASGILGELTLRWFLAPGYGLALRQLADGLAR